MSTSTFSAFLREARSDLSAELLRRLPTSSGGSAEVIVSAFLEAIDANDTESHSRSMREIEEMARARMAPGRPAMKQIAEEISAAHRVLLERARAAVEAGLGGAWDGIARLAEVASVMGEAVAGVFLEAAFASERQYRELYHRSPVVMHSTDTEFRLLDMSDRWLETMEYTREEVLGRVARDFATEATRNLSIATVAPEFFRTGRCGGLHYQYVTKSGKVIDFVLDAVLRRDENGKPLGAISVLVDITERLRIERALRESEERYRLVVERSPLAILVHCEGLVVFANTTATMLMGASHAEEVIGKRVMDLVHPDDRAEIAERVRQLLEGTELVPLREVRLLRIDGAAIDVALMGTSVRHEGKPAIQSIFIDVSERRRAREMTQRSAIQEEVIRAQEESLLALSVPLIPVSERVLVMPLVGRINEGRAQRILEVLLSGVADQGATHVILDVTGVPEADEGMADVLLKASQAVKLLGAKVILTGIQPAFARTLIELGADVGGLVTRGTLSGGIQAAMGRG